MLRFFRLEEGRLRTGDSREEALALLGAGNGFLWLDIEAPTEEDKGVLRQACRRHPLAASDCLASSKYPKLNHYEDLVHMVIHGSSPPAEKGALTTRELDVLWGDRFLLTWHSHPLRSVNAVRERCVREPAVFLGEGPAFALYQILDALVDNWFPFVEALSLRLALLEDRLARRALGGVLEELQANGRDGMRLLRVVDAQRAVLDRMSREPVPFVSSPARQYFRQLYDREVVLHGHLELLREQVHAIRETYLLSVSNDLNQVMKTLTVVSTVLLSVTVVTGIYGMNFQRMPELGWAWGYPMALGLMVLAGGTTYFWIRRKGWS